MFKYLKFELVSDFEFRASDLPRCFIYPRNFTFTCKFPKTNTTHVKVSHVCSFSSAFPATPNYPCGKLRFYSTPLSFCNVCLCSHIILNSKIQDTRTKTATAVLVSWSAEWRIVSWFLRKLLLKWKLHMC
jgi:hypothetical protein